MRHFCGHADRLAERWVRMDGLADIDGIAAHFDGQADFADHVAGTWADNGTTDHAMRFGIENQLGEKMCIRDRCRVDQRFFIALELVG